MSITIAEILDALAGGATLSRHEADAAFGMLMAGQLTPTQTGALLMGLRAKGETAEEVAAAVDAALAQANMVAKRADYPVLVDTCGTGGDHSCSFNCSTAVALCMAALGYPVAKHGNRSMTGNCGSADVLEGMGMELLADAELAAAQLDERGFVFLFAPNFHPAFRHVMPARREMGIRTVFNLMGPLLNPARPSHQLVGVARPELMELMAETLALSGVARAAVVCGSGGEAGKRWDELTTFGPALVTWVVEGDLAHTELDPQDFDFPAYTPAEVAIKNREEGVARMREVLAGKGPKAMQDMCALNLGVTLHLADEESTLGDCMDKARGVIASGVAAQYLRERFGC
ncbi:anthranilate phosphoribosyltransferase [Megalodesulfovibrio gigas]|uniref:Anthranilate phosphoribosyltransferase n=1 Tax=Megalodesulfovibrio gigas (strain ATCC 19364 / DSM 1382 / NCIMB 9332 / VKM B-1759) TaxID=1121448 RepID=T2G9C0_MEGG1|nr:anthranilate phosphoribosyltransferase [Megalodesulfovibrio gigas]AGW12507.1 putative anthranilate phosphoribosyltransferase [Megalodesulfovibrio gigas DSM 1382 = ATCC 19364]